MAHLNIEYVHVVKVTRCQWTQANRPFHKTFLSPTPPLVTVARSDKFGKQIWRPRVKKTKKLGIYRLYPHPPTFLIQASHTHTVKFRITGININKCLPKLP